MIRRPGRDLRRLQLALRRRETRSRPAMPLLGTSLERTVAAWLGELGVPFAAQYRLTPGYAADFAVPALRLVIECHGTYFHADPLVPRARLTAEQRRKRRQDAAVARLLAARGWRRLVLWERDIRARPESCRARLRAVLAPGPETPVSERIAAHTTPTGCLLAVHHGDLTGEPCDAIVNAANGHLSHGSGVAGAIVRRGGDAIQAESDAWVRAHGPVPTGGVALTGAGALPCRAVIHAVGPVWRDGAAGEPELLRAAVAAALSLAAERGFESIALPAISSGVYRFPKELCAEILVGAAEAHAAAQPNGPLREIRFCNFDLATVEVFAAEFGRRYGTSTEE